MNVYHVRRIGKPADISADWDSPDWRGVDEVQIDQFRPEGSDHRPEVRCRLQHDGHGFFGMFRVLDRFVRCVETHYNGNVCSDSCVEFFAQPPGGGGYINFEFNCGGTMLIYHIVDSARTATGFKEWSPVPESEAAAVVVFHTMPTLVLPEIQGQTMWRIGFHIPFSLFQSRFPGMNTGTGAIWRANFYKCCDGSSHPHWASWNAVSDLNFHLPECFGRIVLD